MPQVRSLSLAVTTLALALAPASALAAKGDVPAGPGAPTTPTKVVTLDIVGLTSDQHLVTFPADRPEQSSDLGLITGLLPGERIVGIDRRPASGVLYGLSSASRLFTLSTANAAATLASTLSVSLSGSAFGVDFNPTVDRLRIVSNAGQNLRVNVDTGAVTNDLALNYAASDPFFGATPRVAAAGYTLNDNSTTTATTLLYDIDSATGSLVNQNPPNNGTLVTVGALGTGTGPAALDIFSRTSGGVAVGSTPYAVLGQGLFTVNLATGRAAQVGRFGYMGSAKSATVTDIAVPIDNG